MNALATLSTLPRIVECPTSEVLEHSPISTSFAGYGHDTHEFLVRVAAVGREAALAEIPQDAAHFKLCEAIPPPFLPRGGVVEMAVAYNVISGKGRVLGYNLNRAYPRHSAAEIIGALDWNLVRGDEAVIIDYKSGHRSQGPAARNWQLIGQAVALAAVHDFRLKLVRVALVYLREDGQPFVSEAAFDALAIAAYAERLRRLRITLLALRRDRAAGKALDTRQGPQCTYCPAYESCPAKLAMLVELRDGALGRAEGRLPAISDEEAGALWVRLDDFEAVIRRVRSKLEERARRKAFPTPRGTLICEAPGDPRDVVDGRVALRVLTERYGRELAEAACAPETSKKAIGEAARAHARAHGLPIAREITAALDAIKGAGGMTERPGKVDVREVARKP